jgi:hypothetical protein
MDRIFRDALDISGVRGIMLYSADEKLVCSKFNRPLRSDPEKSVEWALFLNSLKGVQELELLFEDGRLYVRKTVVGPSIVFMDLVPVSMLKLTTELLANSLEDRRIKKELGIQT